MGSHVVGAAAAAAAAAAASSSGPSGTPPEATTSNSINPNADHDENEDTDAEANLTTSLFSEPTDYYAPPPPSTTTTHTLPTGETLSLSLVGHNPLWGHHLFHASRVLASYLHEHAARLCVGKSVLELGAGAGLPGLAAARYGARRVVISDYPDEELVRNIGGNIEQNSGKILQGRRKEEEEGREGDNGEKEKKEELDLRAQGYIWGREPRPECMQEDFDTLILSDLMFNHSQHGALVKTVRDCLKKEEGSRALVFFTPHRPWLVDKDLGLFEVLEREGEGLVAEKVVDVKMEKVMFEGDRGDEELRRTVWGWEVRWSNVQNTSQEPQ